MTKVVISSASPKCEALPILKGGRHNKVRFVDGLCVNEQTWVAIGNQYNGGVLAFKIGEAEFQVESHKSLLSHLNLQDERFNRLTTDKLLVITTEENSVLVCQDIEKLDNKFTWVQGRGVLPNHITAVATEDDCVVVVGEQGVISLSSNKGTNFTQILNNYTRETVVGVSLNSGVLHFVLASGKCCWCDITLPQLKVVDHDLGLEEYEEQWSKFYVHNDNIVIASDNTIVHFKNGEVQAVSIYDNPLFVLDDDLYVTAVYVDPTGRLIVQGKDSPWLAIKTPDSDSWDLVRGFLPSKRIASSIQSDGKVINSFSKTAGCFYSVYEKPTHLEDPETLINFITNEALPTIPPSGGDFEVYQGEDGKETDLPIGHALMAWANYSQSHQNQTYELMLTGDHVSHGRYICPSLYNNHGSGVWLDGEWQFRGYSGTLSGVNQALFVRVR